MTPDTRRVQLHPEAQDEFGEQHFGKQEVWRNGPGIFREFGADGADGTQWGVLPCRAVALLGGITPEQQCPRRSRSLLMLSESREH